MMQQVALVADPGIDTAFAATLALFDPALEVLGLAATAGNVPPQQATKNVHVLIEQVDPPRWPKLGAALNVEYEGDATKLHGPDGLGGVDFPCSQLHNIHPGDKLLTDLIHQHPGELTVVCLGPLTSLATTLERDPTLARQVKRVVVMGGTVHEPGDAGPVSEFHFACDPVSARLVLRSDIPVTLIPLDVSHKLLLSPSDLLELPAESRACRFLRAVVPFGIGASSGLYGVEGFYLADVLGVVAASVPGLFQSEPALVDVETAGELTRGMSVIDRRRRQARTNVDLVTDVDVKAVRNYIDQVLRRTA